MGEYKKTNEELRLYSENLAKKSQMVVFNKIDATIPEIIEETEKNFAKLKPLFISSVSGEGLQPFLYKLKDEVLRQRKARPAKKSEVRKVFRPHLEDDDAKSFKLVKEGDGFRITGKRVEQLAIMTNMEMRGGVYRMQDILKKIGAYREMKKLGAVEGNKIYIANRVFEFLDMD
jgi:GTP-binding protein